LDDMEDSPVDKR